MRTKILIVIWMKMGRLSCFKFMESNKNLIGFFGIGAFSVLTISAFSYLINVVLVDIHLIINAEPYFIFWSSELLTLLIFSVISFISINYIFEKVEHIKRNLLKTFILTIALYFLFQILQFIYTYYGTPFIIDNYNTRFLSYYDYFNKKPLYQSYSSFMVYVIYVVFGIIVFYKIKQKLNSN